MARSRNVGEVEEMINSVEERTEINQIVYDADKLIPTSSTLLNLALSDDPYGGFILGTINNIIGDSSAGKTFLMLSIFAELTYDKRFANHDLDYDEPEAALAFNIPKLFGERVEERINTDYVSGSVEEFHDNVMGKLDEGTEKKKKEVTPFVYALDSLDAICTEDEIDRDIRKGTFGGQKPKLISEILRKIVQNIKKSDSAVFIISQTRDNIGVSFGSKKTRSGGKALKFFCTHELWMAVEGTIKRKERPVGVDVIVKISKNKLTGKLRKVRFPIYYDYGIDDTASCIDFLIEEKVWTEVKSVINTKGYFATEPINRHKLIAMIEDENKKSDLVDLVAKTWHDIESSIATDRKPKYEAID